MTKIDKAFYKAMGLSPISQYDREMLPWLAACTSNEKKTEKIIQIREIHRAHDRRQVILENALAKA